MRATGECYRQIGRCGVLMGEKVPFHGEGVMNSKFIRTSPASTRHYALQERVSKSTGRTYFYNKRTGGSTWEWPTARDSASSGSRTVGGGETSFLCVFKLCLKSNNDASKFSLARIRTSCAAAALTVRLRCSRTTAIAANHDAAPHKTPR